MSSWIVPLALSVALLFPGHASARADDRVFDLDFWAHPRYIDPAFDFEASVKELERARTGHAGEEAPANEERREAGRSR